MSRVRRPVVETDLDTLHMVSEPIDFTDVNEVNEIENAFHQAYIRLEKKAQGLAAIQVGYRKRAIMVRWEKGMEPVILYNPEVKFTFGCKKSNEGCLSEGDGRWLVKRPLLALVRYQNEYREFITEWLPYKKARIFMHEYDHLNGVLLQDKGVLLEGK